MSSSDLSELTSNVSSDDGVIQPPVHKGKLGHYFKHSSNVTQTPPPLKKKRPPSPPHEYVLADNPDIALTLMKTLIIWSLESSDAVKAIIKESYKQSRHDDDLNQPLSVQPWGRDGDKRRFWLIEGQDDTHFRLYRESNPALKHNTWRSIAGTIDEVKDVADKLGEENTQASRRLRDRILAAIPRFEASEEKRRRRDYRLARKAQFVRPEPGFSLYEGRTRGKRIRYTYSDEEDAGLDGMSTRRSIRHSGVSTPAEPAGPTFTASGRQVRSRHGGVYGEIMLSGHHKPTEADSGSGMDVADDEDHEPIRGRARRAAHTNGVKPEVRAREAVDDFGSSDSVDDASDATSSGQEWDGGDDDDPDDQLDEEEDEQEIEVSDEGASRTNFEDTDAHRSLVVSLRYAKVGSSPAPPDDLAMKNPTNYTAATRPSAASIAEDAEILDVPPSRDRIDRQSQITQQPISPQPSARTSQSLRQVTSAL
ncbi:MAG: hypothetical protein Q9217_003338 [Psora testacea]